MTKVNALRGVVVAVGAVVGVLAPAGGAPAALASAPTVTLSGRASNGTSPDSDVFNAVVSATLSKGVVSGSLETGEPFGPISGEGRDFEGKVTCMRIKGTQVAVGAFGTASFQGTPRPGKYVQLLTVEFGEFPNEIEEYGAPFTFSYGLLSIEGAPGKSPPKCGEASFAHQQFDPHFNASGIFFHRPSDRQKTGMSASGRQ